MAVVRRHPVPCVLVGLAAGLALLLAVGGGSGKGEEGSNALTDQLLVALSSVAQPRPVAAPAPPRQVKAVQKQKARRAKRKGIHEIATVLPGGLVALYDKPRGSRIAVVGDSTEFGSDTNFWVVRHRRGWLGVTTELRGNGRLAWIPRRGSALRFGHTAWWLDADARACFLAARRDEEEEEAEEAASEEAPAKAEAPKAKAAKAKEPKPKSEKKSKKS